MGELIPFPEKQEREVRKLMKLGFTQEQAIEIRYWDAFFEYWYGDE
jgi:hypothetical protein